ncbi:nickel permease [Janthinobacterium sp. ROICE36]|uniref:HoxN/HupN/NixA family nickel/cobalt transporter n=1 Tax=Janthinobacterium sp. ROICE36 TaxID=2048670 RepID=UPI000C7F094E|nr:nickel permease [Janthinobacterium sp. ROICE36]PLY45781.1 nickel permease [Janthinobacterium sp. ROICE36]
MSADAGLPALALIFLLGMRHGLEPDHLAAVDGLTLRSQLASPRWTPWMGALFALGHGLCVLAIVAVAALAARQLSPSENVFDWLEWLPIALLLLIAGLNARSVLAGAQLAEVRGRLLPGWLRGVSGPLGAILVGILFALVFDTALQAAAWGYAAVALGGMQPALLTGLVFAVGMGVTDTFDGWVTAKVMRTGKMDIVRAFRRRLGWPIVAICVAMAGYMAAGKLDPAWSLPESWVVALGGAMLLLMAALYGWTLHGLRTARVH